MVIVLAEHLLEYFDDPFRVKAFLLEFANFWVVFVDHHAFPAQNRSLLFSCAFRVVEFDEVGADGYDVAEINVLDIHPAVPCDLSVLIFNRERWYHCAVSGCRNRGIPGRKIQNSSASHPRE